MISTKKYLPRRTFIRGVGVTLALPLLDSMVPAFTALRASAAKPVSRLFVGYVPNGVMMNKWTPSTVGAAFELQPILEPLAAFQDQLLLVSGLTCAPAGPLPGEGTGDHVGAAATFLTSVHPKKTEGPDIRGGVSIDQIVATKFSKDTQLASLEVCLDANELIGACEAGWSCAYANTLSWRTPTTPMPMENQPRVVFERLFGDSDDTSQAARIARIQEERSILDSLIPEVGDLQKSLAPHDRSKIDQYLEAIRDVERRLQLAEVQSAKELPAVGRPAGGIPDTFVEHARVMFDLLVLAYQTDMTRVLTFMMARELSPRSYPEIGISDSHHGLSHHGNRAQQMEKLAKLNNYHVQQLAYFMERLRSTPDGDGSLLDHVMILYGCGISDGNLHLHTDLPILLAGGGTGQLKGGRHIRCAKDTPLANLELTILEKLGVPMESLGDSTGRVKHLSGV